MKMKRYFNRLVSMLLVGCMLITLLPSFGALAAETETVVFEQDFEDLGEGKNGTDAATVTGGSVEAVEYPESSGNHVLHIVDDNAGGTTTSASCNAQFRFAGTPASGEVIISSRVYLADNDSVLYMTCGSNADAPAWANTTNGQILRLSIGGNTNQRVQFRGGHENSYANDGNSANNNNTYNVGDWTQIKVVLDLDEGTFTVYTGENETSLGSGTLGYPTAAAVDEFTEINNVVFMTDGSKTADVYVDDIVVSKKVVSEPGGDTGDTGDTDKSEAPFPDTIVAEGKSFASERYAVTGEGNQVLTFTVTPSAVDNTLKSGIKFYSKVSGSTAEVLRFKMDSGYFRLSDLRTDETSGSVVYEKLGDAFEADKTYTLKLVIVPAKDDEPASATLYERGADGEWTQRGATYTVTQSEVGGITGVTFFTDSGNTVTTTFKAIKFESIVEPEPEEPPKEELTETEEPADAVYFQNFAELDEGDVFYKQPATATEKLNMQVTTFDGSKVLEFLDNDGSGYSRAILKIAETGEELSGEVTISYKLYDDSNALESPASTSQGISFVCGSEANTLYKVNDSNYQILRVKTTAGKLQHKGGNDASNTSVNSAYTQGAWVTVKVVLNTVEKTYTVYVDDVEKATGNLSYLSSGSAADAALDKIDNIGFMSDSSGVAHMYIDDITVTVKKLDEPDPGPGIDPDPEGPFDDPLVVEGASFSKAYDVEGQGNQVLTFTVTPSATSGLKGGVKFSADDESGEKVEVLRFALDAGVFKIAEAAEGDALSYTELGTYIADQDYTLKLVIVPAKDDDPAFVKLYQITDEEQGQLNSAFAVNAVDAGAATQLGGITLSDDVDVSKITQLDFFTDGNSQGTFTYNDISFEADAELSEEEATPPSGGEDPDDDLEEMEKPADAVYFQNFADVGESDILNKLPAADAENLYTKIAAFDGSKVLEFLDKDTGSGTTRAMFKFDEAQSGEITISYDMYINSDIYADTSKATGITFVCGSTENATGMATGTDKQILRLKVYNNKFQHKGGGDSGTTDAGSYTQDQWFSVKLVLKTGAGTYDFYVKAADAADFPETATGSGKLSYTTASYALDKIDNFGFTSDTSGVAHVYVDNIAVTVKAEEEPEVPPVVEPEPEGPFDDPLVVEGASFSKAYDVEGQGNQVLTFTVTPEATTGLKGGVRMFTDDASGKKVEVLRFKLDAGTFRVAEYIDGTQQSYVDFGKYTAETAYELKLVIVPADGDTPAFVKLYELKDGVQTQIGDAVTVSADVSKITQLTFFTDGSSAGTYTYEDIDFQADAQLSTEEATPPSTSGGGEEPDEPDEPEVVVPPTDDPDWGEAFTQDFEGKVEFQGTTTDAEVIDEPDQANKVLEINDPDSTTGKAIFSFDAQSGKIAVSFRVKILDDDTTLYMLLGSHERSGNWSSSNAGQMLRLTFSGGKLQFRGAYRSSNASATNNSYTVGTWMPVKVVLDTKAGTFGVYSGDTLLGADKLGYPLNNGEVVTADLSDVDNINFATNSTNKAHAYIDDIVITAEDVIIVGDGGTEYWDVYDLTLPMTDEGDAGEGFTTTTDQVIATLPESGVTMAVGAAEWNRKDPSNGKPVTINGVTYTKYITGKSGNSPKVAAGTGEYFKFAIPADIDAGELTVALRVNSEKTLVVQEDGVDMAGYEEYQPAPAATTAGIKINVVGGKTYTVYVDTSMPYFYGFSFRPVDMEADIALFQEELDKLDFNWIRGENTDPNAVDKDLELTTFYTSRNFGGADVNWTSSSVAVSGDGKVNQLATDTLVTLTAHISVQQISYLALDKEFKVTVKALTDDAEAVARAKEALTLGSISAVKKDLELPAEGMHGTTITWVSSNPEVLTVDAASGLGVIHPNDAEAQTVTLTATITRGNVTETKEFVVTVAPSKILDVNSWAYATAEGTVHFVPVDGGKLHSINVTNNNQHLDTDDYKFKVEILGADGTVKATSQEYTASDFFIHGVGVSENVVLDLSMDSGDTFRVTAYDDAKTYVTVTHSAADDVVAPGAKIYVIGDSTAAPYENKKYPQTGWAQVLEGFFDGVEVVDLALPGRSSLDYKTKPNFETLKNSIGPGDYLIIQFGHNDSHNADASIYTDPTLDRFADGAETPSYKKHMAEYVTLAWDAGAYPIIATSISRRKLNDTDGLRYGNAAKALAAELSIPCVDVLGASNGWVNYVGLEESIDMFNIIKPQDSRFYNDPQYAESEIRETGNDAVVANWDNTHVNYYGAKLIAMFAADGIKTLGIPVGAKRNSETMSTTLPHYADAISGEAAELPEELTVTAEEGSDLLQYPVSGAGRHELTFTVTPDANVSGGVKFFTGTGSAKEEALRLEMDNGHFTLYVAPSATAAYASLFAATEGIDLGTYTPGTTYTLKVVITPKVGQTPAQVEVFKVEGAAQTQMGDTCTMNDADVKEITRLDFFADTDTTGSFTYSDIDYNTETIPELEYTPDLEYTPPTSGGDDGDGDGDESSAWHLDGLTVTADAEKGVSNKFTVSGQGNQVLTFTFTTDNAKADAETGNLGLGGGVKFFANVNGSPKEVLRFKIDLGTFKVTEVVDGTAKPNTNLDTYEANTTYTIKAVIVPAAGDQPAFVKFYRVDGETQTQLGETYAMTDTDLSEIIQLDFFADSKRQGAYTYTDLNFYSNAELSEEESTPPESSGEDVPTPPPAGGSLPESLTVPATGSSATYKYSVTTGEGNVALTFTVTPSAATGLAGGVRLYSSDGGTDTERVGFKLENGAFKVREGADAKYTTLGSYQAGVAYTVKLVLVPGDEGCTLYVCLDGQQIASLPLSLTDPKVISKVGFFVDSNTSGTLAYTGVSYASGVDYTPQTTPAATTQYLLKNPDAWTLSANGNSSITDEKLILQADENTNSNRIDVSGDGIKSLSFDVAVNVDDVKNLKGGVNFAVGGKTVLRFKMQNGGFRLSDIQTDANGSVVYQQISGSFSKQDSFRIKVDLYPATATQDAYVKVYKDGKVICTSYVPKGETASMLGDVNRLYFFADSNSSGTYTYTDMVYKTGPMTPAQTGAIDFAEDGWKLQLPVEDPGKSGSVMEVSPAELADGYSDEYFYAAMDENGDYAVVFHSPVEGFKTANAKYTRSELREMLDPADKNVNWTWENTHILTTEQRVTHVPASGQVITSQIHGIEKNGDNANPLVKVRYVYDAAAGTGKIVVELKETTASDSGDQKYEFANVALGQKYKTVIKVEKGVASVTISTVENGTERKETYSYNFVAADAQWKDTLYYFKVGNYIQDNTDTSEDAYSDVWVYSATVQHPSAPATSSGSRGKDKTEFSDGGSTVTETKSDGTVVTIHTTADGDVMRIQQNPDGTVQITVTAKNGNSEVNVDAAGQTQAKVEISESAASKAQQNGEALNLPLPQLTPGKDLDSAPVVEIAKRAGSELVVKMPVNQPTPGTVVVAVNPDGTQEIIKMSVVTEDGILFKVSGNVTVKLVDNAKQFDDVDDRHWAAEAVDFASGRELLVGTAENLFSPDGTTTRAMVVTILARLDGTDTDRGETWYSKGMDWAVSQGVSDGTNPEALISREQFVTMLYRYGGQPAVAGNALNGFTDSVAVSSWAAQAMEWAVQNGIMRGKTSDTLDPAGTTTRAEATTLLMRYCQWALGVPLEVSTPSTGTEETVAFENDFEAEKLGRAWVVGTKVVDLDGNQVVEITDTSSTENTALNYQFPSQSGKVSISFKLYIDPADADSVIVLTAGSFAKSGKYSSNSNGEYLRLKTVASSKRFQFRGGDSTKTSAVNGGSYRCGEWIDVKVIVDTDTKTFSVYAGGELLGENQPLSSKGISNMSRSDIGGIDNITFMTEKEGLSHVYIDDVKVTSKQREFSVWDESVDDYATVAGGTGLLKDSSQWNLKQGEIKGGALIVTAGEDSASNKIAVSGTGNKALAFTVVSNNETGAKGGVRFMSAGKEILRFKLDGGKFKVTDMRVDEADKTLYATLGSYSEDTAYAVRILILEKSVKVYVDGQQLGSTYTLTDEAAAALKNVTELNFFTDKAVTGTLTYTDMTYETGVDAGEDASAQGGASVDLSQTPAGTGAIDFLKDGWKIQLPIENPAKAGSVMERTPQELADGYTDEFIYAAKDEDGTPAVVFHSPVEGFKTGNTSYARSELRELIDPSDSKVNWTWQGTHTLVAEERVTHVPASGQVITSQIHGIEQNGDNANPLVKVRYVYDYTAQMGKVVVELKNTTSPTSYDFKYSFPNVALGQKYKTEIQVVDGSVCVTIATTDPDGTERSETYRHDFVVADPYWKETWYYFKLGNYIQDNTDTSDGAYADVWVYSSGITHTDTVDKIPVSTITMDQPSVSIRSGERTGLSVSAAPIKAYDKSVTWAVTAGSDVAVVDKDGFVTGIKEGVATVTATSVSNPAATASCTVTVRDVAVVEVKPIFAQDFGTDAAKTDPAGYTSADVEITKSAPAGTDVSVVNEGGNNLVTLRDDSSDTATKLSFVFAPQTDTTTIAFKVRIDDLGEHTVGGTDFGRMYIVAAGSDSWYSDDTELFRIRNNAKGTLGNFSGLTYVLTNYYNEITQNADKVTGSYGDWVDVVYIVTPNNGTAKANTTDVYMNGYPVAMAVANRNTVDYLNRLDIQTGTADKLTFSVDDVKVYTGIVLPENTALTKPTSLALVRVPSVMAVADSAQAAVEVTPAEGYENVNWSVVSGDAVTVSDDGYVTAAKTGEAVIRAESTLDSTVYAQKTITVQSTVVRPTSLVVPATVHVAPGGSQQLQVTVLPADATEKGLKYEIASGSDVAAVDSRGVVTGKTVGTATVRITSLSDSSVYETVPVSVTQTLTPGEVIFADNFNAGELSSANWSVSLAKDNTFVEMEDGAMTFIDANTAANPKVTLDFTPASGKMSIQFKIKVLGEVTMQGGSVKSTGYRNLRIAFGSGNIATTANESFCIRSNGTYFTYNTSGSTYVEMPGDYDISEWNEVTLVTTINAAGADTTDVYVNGVKVLSGAPNKVDYPAIDKLCFSADTANVAAFTVDDLGIWAGDISDKPADLYAKRFSDVPAGHWAQEAISFASERGLLNGVGDGAFAPDATTTRATLVTILARLDGVDTSGGETWYSKGTDWAVSKGISDGTNPDGPISREQFVTMLYRYAGQPATAGQTLGGFADSATVSDWAIPAMEWAVSTGLMTGRTDGTLDPAGTTTRAEAAALLMRYCQQSEAGR